MRNSEVIAFATLYATDVGQVAYEYKEKKQGYFTWAIVQGLKGEAANDTGEVTLAGLVKYLQEVVPKRVQLDLGGGKKQKPFAIIEGYKADDLVLSVSNALLTTVKPRVLQQSPDAIELSFWETIRNSTNPEDFKAYLRQFPNGRFADLARNRANPPLPTTDMLQQVTQKTTSRDFVFELLSCRMSGSIVTCYFTAINESTRDKGNCSECRIISCQ